MGVPECKRKGRVGLRDSEEGVAEREVRMGEKVRYHIVRDQSSICSKHSSD